MSPPLGVQLTDEGIWWVRAHLFGVLNRCGFLKRSYSSDSNRTTRDMLYINQQCVILTYCWLK